MVPPLSSIKQQFTEEQDVLSSAEVVGKCEQMDESLEKSLCMACLTDMHTQSKTWNMSFSMCSHFKLGVTETITQSLDSHFWLLLLFIDIS